MPPVLPIVTATPRYPVEAIREAKQGRVVTCFLVDAAGTILGSDMTVFKVEALEEEAPAASVEESRPEAGGENGSD